MHREKIDSDGMLMPQNLSGIWLSCRIYFLIREAEPQQQAVVDPHCLQEKKKKTSQWVQLMSQSAASYEHTVPKCTKKKWMSLTSLIVRGLHNIISHRSSR